MGLGRGRGAGFFPPWVGEEERWWQDGDGPSVLAERCDPVRPIPKAVEYSSSPSLAPGLSMSVAPWAWEIWNLRAKLHMEPPPVPQVTPLAL